MPIKVSIVVPIFNNSKHLATCLDALINQTLKDIEIVCIDDGSEDNSVEILEQYKDRFPDVVKCIYHNENLSASQCRKDGVLASSGEYIMFCDADDYFEVSACKTAYKAIKKQNTDILQFGTKIENCAGLPESRIELNRKLLKPFTGMTLNGNLNQECFIKMNFGATIWNKIVDGEICRRAFSEVEDGYFPKSNDLYAVFLILKNAQSYSGIETPLYNYRFGLGMTGSQVMGLENFKLHCQGTLVLNALRKNIESEDENLFEEYSLVCDKIENNFLNEQCARWFSNLAPEYKHAGLCEMEAAWGRGYHFIISNLAEKFWYERKLISSYLKDFSELARSPRNIKTIALYYHRIAGGGAQRVVAQTCNMLASAKNGQKFRYNVILVTDELPSKNDYPISPRVSREVIPAADQFPKHQNYETRCNAWMNIIDKYDVDLVINSAWLSSVNLWDMLSIKSHPRRPAYINHTHSFFALLFRIRNKALEMLSSYSIADGVITLSEMDREIWSNFNQNTYLIINPAENFSGSKAEYRKDKKRILWLARISHEKQPLEMVRIMEYVAQEHPEVICNIVGDGSNEMRQKLRQEITDRNLENNINIQNFTTDVGIYYSSSSVFVMTSSYEGFGLTLLESSSFGLPIVMYDLPWLEFFKLFKGWKKVPQSDAKAAAEQICVLLNDKTEWNKSSKELIRSFAEYEKIDILPAWESVFDDLKNGTAPNNTSSVFTKTLIEQIANFHQQDIEREVAEHKRLQKQLSNSKPASVTAVNYGSFGWRRIFIPIIGPVVRRIGTDENFRHFLKNPTDFFDKIHETRYRILGKIFFPKST